MFERVRLYISHDIYAHKATERLFLRALQKNIEYHRKHCREYGRLLKRQGFRSAQLKAMEDLHRLPFLPTLYLKRHRLLSMPLCRLPVKAASSGTSGVKSFVGYNLKTVMYAGIMTVRMISHHHLFSWKPTNYMILGYEPHPSNTAMITKTQNATTFFAPPLHRAYALRYGRNGYRMDDRGMEKALARYAGQRWPVRLVGLPAYAYFFLQKLREQGISYELPPGSMVLLGGGWKEYDKEEQDKAVLYQLIKEVLGIPEENCREFFGVAEHPVMYCSCPNHHFHVPNFSRVIIRDVKTWKPVKDGETGLVNLLTPVADSMPLLSIVTDDLGILRPGSDCGCGIETPYLEIVGRAGVEGIKTCAAAAADFLRNGDRDEG